MPDEAVSEMSIAELARRAGVTPRTVRYYVAEGLLPPARGQGQRRAYGPEHLRQLAQIRRLKAAYLPLHEIRTRLGAGHAGETDGTVDVEAIGAVPDGSPSGAPAGSLPRIMSPTTGMRTLPAPVSITGQGRPGAVAAGSLRARSSAQTGSTAGFGGPPQVGRIEIFEDVETSWRRVILAPGVELHYRDRDAPLFIEAIQRLVREARGILNRPSERQPDRRSDQGTV